LPAVVQVSFALQIPRWTFLQFLVVTGSVVRSAPMWFRRCRRSSLRARAGGGGGGSVDSCARCAVVAGIPAPGLAEPVAAAFGPRRVLIAAPPPVLCVRFNRSSGCSLAVAPGPCPAVLECGVHAGRLYGLHRG
jgi:hypothetical protein